MYAFIYILPAPGSAMSPEMISVLTAVEAGSQRTQDAMEMFTVSSFPEVGKAVHRAIAQVKSVARFVDGLRDNHAGKNLTAEERWEFLHAITLRLETRDLLEAQRKKAFCNIYIYI